MRETCRLAAPNTNNSHYSILSAENLFVFSVQILPSRWMSFKLKAKISNMSTRSHTSDKKMIFHLNFPDRDTLEGLPLSTTHSPNSKSPETYFRFLLLLRVRFGRRWKNVPNSLWYDWIIYIWHKKFNVHEVWMMTWWLMSCVSWSWHANFENHKTYWFQFVYFL